MSKELIIVTGSSGRIGTQVVKRLGQENPIVGFELLKAIYASEKEELIPVDMGSEESVVQAFTHIKNFYGTKIKSVIHLAAYYSFSEQHSPKYDQITVKGTERLLKELKNFEVEQFIFTSTMLVHAPTKPGMPIVEEAPIHPTWDYPLSKAQTEKIIHELRGSIPTVILRIAGVYDDGCNSIPISHQIQRIYEKKLISRLFAGNIHHGACFVHMDDVVNAITLAVQKRKELPPETVLLIGEDKTLSYDAMQREISCLLFGKEFKTYSVPKWFAKMGAFLQCLFAFKHQPFIRPWMIDFADDHYELDTSKAKQLLGWEPKHSLEVTLPMMTEDLLKDPQKWYTRNHLNGK
ncbi:MAG TPA: NAD(P)-dependent oxidoreductase [Chlamydiales bacterium]|nr:NAD(P)-dependent oxidoreductase [Chlamydiales bacterium]